MQYKISPRTNLDGARTHRTWEVIGFKENKGETVSWGVITRFNTEEQARDYIAVQEGIAVRLVRIGVAPRQRDFKVLINGEHRATFHKRSYGTGYYFRSADDSDIGGIGPVASDIIQADFELIVRTAIAKGKVPTIAQIERAQLVEQAWEDNHAWDEAKSKHRALLRKQVLEMALENYLGQPFGSDEHKATAARMLDGVRSGSGWCDP